MNRKVQLSLVLDTIWTGKERVQLNVIGNKGIQGTCRILNYFRITEIGILILFMAHSFLGKI